jgi:protein TonB
MTIQLSEFHHNPPPDTSERSSRATAGVLTALLYAAFGALVWWSLLHPPVAITQPEIVASLLENVPAKRAVEPLPPFIARLIKPRAEKAALPVFTVASGAPPQAPAPLPASAAKTSPMLGGTSGNGPMGQAASGNGTGGNGGGTGGCIDPAWMRAVSDRVRQFFYYPDAALASRTTGVAMMHFVVRRDGRIEKLEIGKSSGNAELDKAAADILQKAQPLPPIPARMHTDRVDGQLPINFGMRRFAGTGTIGNCSG